MAAARPALAVEIELGPRVPSPTAAWDAARRLGDTLRGSGWPTVTVRVNDNRHSMIRYGERHGRLNVSVHWRLVDRTDDLLALIREKDASAWNRLKKDLEGHPPRVRPLPPHGEVHDLEALGRAEQVWLPRPVEAQVGWGRWPGRAPDRVLRLGSCSSGPTASIAIHPVLDHADVPGWFVGFVVFHELLHVVHPPEAGTSRRRVHTPTFARAERTHPEFHRANAWEVANVPRLMERIRERLAGRA